MAAAAPLAVPNTSHGRRMPSVRLTYIYSEKLNEIKAPLSQPGNTYSSSAMSVRVCKGDGSYTLLDGVPGLTNAMARRMRCPLWHNERLGTGILTPSLVDSQRYGT